MRANEFIVEGVAEGFLNETTSQLGPQLYTPRPKNLDESMKPDSALWTSTASGSNNGYTSAWVEWAKSEMPQWVGHGGFLYDVSPSARILTINSDRDAMRVANKYGMHTTDIMDLFMYMPWKKIAKDYDAIHHVPSNRGADLFMHSWDVESTAWFNTKMLLNKRKVPILASKKGVAEGLHESLSSLVAQDQSERNEYKNFVKSQAGGDWTKGAKMYARFKKRPSNDIFGDATRLNQFMKMKFDFDKFTDEDWDNYWLLAQHCDDNRDFQKNALSIIKKYQGTDHSHYKYLYDRISMGLTGKQKYGTQNVKEQGVAESLNELTNTSLKVKQPKDFVNTNDRKQVTWKVMKFKSGKDTYLINFTMQDPPAFGKKSKSNWNAVNVAFGVKEPQDEYSFGDEINTDLTARNKNQFLIYSTVINAIRKFITEYNTEIDEIIMQGAGERQQAMYQRFFQSAGKYFPGWHYNGKHSLVRDVPRQTGKKVREQGVVENN